VRLRASPPLAAACDVVGFGLNAVDHLCRVPVFPTFDSKMLLEGYECQPGGQVATALVALQRWGLRTAYLGTFGSDPLGALARAALVDEGVAVDGCITRAGARNQLAVILVDGGSGERTVLWHRDAALVVRPEEIDPKHVCAGRVLHLDGFDCDAAIEAAGWARTAGIPTVLDMDSPRGRVEGLLRHIDIAIVPRAFALQFGDGRDPAAALPALARFNCALVGVTLGQEGSVAWCEGRTFRTPAFPVSCVDTTGAGDVFHAAMIYGLLAGWDVETMLHFANAAAALQCTRLGAQPGIPTLEAALALARTRS
jgi:sulfofructose kinase